MDYHLDIQYKAGSSNTAADVLSRPLCSMNVVGVNSVLSEQLVYAWSHESVLCDEDRKFLQLARSTNAEFKVRAGMVWRSQSNDDSQSQLVIPHSLVDEVIALAHDIPTSGHFGVRKTIN